MSDEHNADLSVVRRPWLFDVGLAQIHDLCLEPATGDLATDEDHFVLGIRYHSRNCALHCASSPLVSYLG